MDFALSQRLQIVRQKASDNCPVDGLSWWAKLVRLCCFVLASLHRYRRRSVQTHTHVRSPRSYQTRMQTVRITKSADDCCSFVCLCLVSELRLSVQIQKPAEALWMCVALWTVLNVCCSVCGSVCGSVSQRATAAATVIRTLCSLSAKISLLTIGKCQWRGMDGVHTMQCIVYSLFLADVVCIAEYARTWYCRSKSNVWSLRWREFHSC